MTLEEQFKARATAPMATPDRLKGLMDAAIEHARLTALMPILRQRFADVDTMSYFGKLFADKLDDTREAQYLAQEEVAAWASALLDDGTLENCRDFLANRDQFRQAVERAKLERTRPKDRSKLTALWARIFHRRQAAQAPSPTR